MPLYLTSAAYSAITPQMLATSRDARQARQKQWLAQYDITLISFTVLAPGTIKDTLLTRSIFNHGFRALRLLTEQSVWEIKKQRYLSTPCGPEGLLAINAPADVVKLATIGLETTHRLGRLWDIDVLNAEGKILSRSDFGLPPRHCLLCSRAAAICARERKHSLPELTTCMETLLSDGENI